MDEKGLILDTGIIKVNVVSNNLMDTSFFNGKSWYWVYDNRHYYYDKGEKCRLKVLETTFKSPREISLLSQNMAVPESKESQSNKESEKENIMQVFCTVEEEGLGPVSWWE